MNYREFVSRIRDMIGKMPGNEGMRTKLEKIIRSGDIIRDGLILERKDVSASPVIYMDEFYEFYNNNGLSLEEMADLAMQVLNNASDWNMFDAEKFRIWENVRNNITFRLMNIKLNRKYLDDTVYDEYLDLALVYYITVKAQDNELYRCKVHGKMFDAWGIDKEELRAQAIENTRSMLGIKLQEIHEAFMEAADIRDWEKMKKIFADEGSIPMFVLTNQYGLYGAANMFIDDVMKSLAEMFDKDLYIIPSSTHEVMIIPVIEMITRDYLNNMIREINSTVLDPEEILSDHVYIYSRELERIIL